MTRARVKMLIVTGLGSILLAAGPSACTQSPAESAVANNSATAAAPDPIEPDNGANVANAVAPEDVAAPINLHHAEPEDLPASNDSVDAKPFPKEVTAFMVARDSCDHFRGEEAYDEDRRAYLEENIRELCTGTDERLASLRRRYADDADVTSALSGYEEKIEQPAEE